MSVNSLQVVPGRLLLSADGVHGGSVWRGGEQREEVLDDEWDLLNGFLDSSDALMISVVRLVLLHVGSKLSSGLAPLAAILQDTVVMQHSQEEHSSLLDMIIDVSMMYHALFAELKEAELFNAYPSCMGIADRAETPASIPLLSSLFPSTT